MSNSAHHKAMIDRECALMQLRKATDSRGLLVRLPVEDFTPKGIRKGLQRFAAEALATDEVAYLYGFGEPSPEDADPELTWARNLQLLVNAYVASLEHAVLLGDEYSEKRGDLRL